MSPLARSPCREARETAGRGERRDGDRRHRAPPAPPGGRTTTEVLGGILTTAVDPAGLAGADGGPARVHRGPGARKVPTGTPSPRGWRLRPAQHGPRLLVHRGHRVDRGGRRRPGRHKPLEPSPSYIEVKRAHLYPLGPVGFGSRRRPVRAAARGRSALGTALTRSVCATGFERPDMAVCPLHQGAAVRAPRARCSWPCRPCGPVTVPAPSDHRATAGAEASGRRAPVSARRHSLWKTALLTSAGFWNFFFPR